MSSKGKLHYAYLTISTDLPTFCLVFGISTKGIYGLTAVFELAARFDEGPIQIKEIAERHSIPQHYLEQLLVSLRRNGITASFRGTQGGYRLAAHPDTISVKAVLEALEGPLELVPEEKRGSEIQFFFNQIENLLSDVLQLTLSELLERKNSGPNMYFI